MRTSAAIAVAAVLLAGCGPSPSSDTDAIVVTPPPTTPVTKVPRTNGAGTDVSSSISLEPGTNPSYIERQTADVERLSVEDALLPDDALGAAWEFRQREVDRIGLAAGENQTTCADYWTFESLLARDGGLVTWWRDGGNANQHVIRMADDAELVSLLVALAEMPASCPVVAWLEGGSFTTELIELEDAIGLRFDEQESDRTTWVVATAHGDLLSILHITLWTSTDEAPPGMTQSELSSLATQMLDRLVAAGTAERVPVIVPATTTTEPAPKVTDPPVEPDGSAELLLNADELPAGWELDGIDAYRHNPGDDPFDDCPAARSIEIVDRFLEWEATFTTPTGREAFELIGDYGSLAGATDLVEMFAQIADCELDGLFEEADWSGGLEQVAGADRAARLTANIPDEGYGGRLDLMLMAVDSIVIVVSHDGPTDDGGAALYDLAERAATKAAAG